MLLSDSPYPLPIPEGWRTPIRDWELLLTTNGQRPATIDTRIRHLRRVARDLNTSTPAEVTPAMLTSWSGSQQWAPETRHSHHQSVKLFYRWYSSECDQDSPAEAVFGKIRRHTPPAKPTPEDILHVALADSTPRTELILRLAAELGLRCGEIAHLRHDQLTSTPDGWVLEVNGKGGKARQLPCPTQLAAKINTLGNSVWVFPGNNEGHLSPRWVSKLASRQLPSTWTLHTLRHRFATTAYNKAGHDIIALQQALGHESVQTTQRYTAHNPQNIQHLVQVTQIP